MSSSVLTEKTPLPRLTLRDIVCWIIALGAYLAVVARGWHSMHQGYGGDDIQLYDGVRHLFSIRSFYVPTANAYPPAIAWFYLPFAFFSWPVAHHLWFLFSTGVCLPCLGWVLFRQFGRNLPAFVLPLWLAVLFLSAPPYVVAFFGQIFFPMALALAAAWGCAYSRRPGAKWVTGLLYAVALTKPTIALPFLIYQFLRKPTRAGAACGILITLVLTLATAAVYPRPIQMVTEYRATIHSLVTPGALNDTGFTNKRRHFLFNMGILLFDVVRSVDGVHQKAETAAEQNAERLLEAVAALAACGLMAYAALRINALQADAGESEHGVVPCDKEADAWAFASLTLLAMLLFYHAWTDFGMLYMPLIVVLNALASKQARHKPNLAAMMSVLILILFVLARNRELFAWQNGLARLLLPVLFFQLTYALISSLACGQQNSADTHIPQ